MRKCIVRHIVKPDGSQGWKCGKYLMSSSVTFSMESERCYHFRCPGRNNPLPKCRNESCDQHVSYLGSQYCSPSCEEHSTQDLPKEPVSSAICFWDTCENPIIPPKKKFCSLACKNRSTSRTYRKKQRERRCSIQK